jgi:hypothetical protein
MAETNPDQRLMRHMVADWLYDYWLEILLIVIPALAALSALVYSDEFTHAVCSSADNQLVVRKIGIIAFVAFTILQICAGIFSAFRTKRISALEEQINAERARANSATENSMAWIQDIYALCDGFLYVMSTSGALKLSNTDRISIYAHDPTSDSFLKLARYSPNEEFRKTGRRNYPVAQGCIGRAWTDDECYVAEFPLKEANETAFYATCSDYNIPRNVAAQLRMPSKFYFGKKIRNRSGTVALGVVIIESETVRRFSLSDLREVFNGQTGQHLRELIGQISPRIPRSRIATEAGF